MQLPILRPFFRPDKMPASFIRLMVLVMVATTILIEQT